MTQNTSKAPDDHKTYTRNKIDDYEKAFLLAVPLDFRMYEAVDESDEEERLTIAFSWLDLSSPESFERFEFVISSQREDCSLSEVERVVDVVTQCIVSAQLSTFPQVKY